MRGPPALPPVPALPGPTQSVYVFPITGGPCAGKTTALAHLLQHQDTIFPSFNVDVVPEAATLYHQYGARLPFGQPASLCGKITENDRNLVRTRPCHRPRE